MAEAIIGLEVHAELQTRSKMFCSCPVVDPELAKPNTAVCPVCTGMPGTLPVVNRQAVAAGIKVALALGCEVQPVSIFARKNYFYPDLPKGYQITQYEHPLARQGMLTIHTAQSAQPVRIRRIHLEEDTGKLTHVTGASLVDLNRAGVPLLEIVSEPDMRSPEQARAYAEALRHILLYLEVNSGEMQKGRLRFEANVSVRPTGSQALLTRTEIKNLNSLRALERAIAYEIERQVDLHQRGEPVLQQTMGWDEQQQVTFPQRGKEQADDYRYFPEPDLPALAIAPGWIAKIRDSLPELPARRAARFVTQYQLAPEQAEVLTTEPALADYFEAAAAAAQPVPATSVAHWLQGELFNWMNQHQIEITALAVGSDQLAELLQAVETGRINANTGKRVLAEMLASGTNADTIIQQQGLEQISDQEKIATLIGQLLQAHPEQLADYQAGKANLLHWFFGQVMKATGGQADPQLVRQELKRKLEQA